jgi:hypothetical protein
MGRRDGRVSLPRHLCVYIYMHVYTRARSLGRRGWTVGVECRDDRSVWETWSWISMDFNGWHLVQLGAVPVDGFCKHVWEHD